MDMQTAQNDDVDTGRIMAAFPDLDDLARVWLLGGFSPSERRALCARADNPPELNDLLDQIGTDQAAEQYRTLIAAADCTTKEEAPYGLSYPLAKDARTRVPVIDFKKTRIDYDFNRMAEDPIETLKETLGIPRAPDPSMDGASLADALFGPEVKERFERQAEAIRGLVDRLDDLPRPAVDVLVLGDAPHLAIADEPAAGWRISYVEFARRELLWLARHHGWAAPDQLAELRRRLTPGVMSSLIPGILGHLERGLTTRGVPTGGTAQFRESPEDIRRYYEEFKTGIDRFAGREGTATKVFWIVSETLPLRPSSPIHVEIIEALAQIVPGRHLTQEDFRRMVEETIIPRRLKREEARLKEQHRDKEASRMTPEERSNQLRLKLIEQALRANLRSLEWLQAFDPFMERSSSTHASRVGALGAKDAEIADLRTYWYSVCRQIESSVKKRQRHFVAAS